MRRLLFTLGCWVVAGELAAQTHQDFDNPGSSFLLCSHSTGAPAGVRRDPLAVDFSGRFLRLATSPAPSHNSALFEVKDPSPCQRDLDLEFDFRLSPQEGRGDGLGVALLRKSSYPGFTCVAPEGPYFAAEEPSFRESLGLGFDIHQNAQDGDANHVSVHYQGVDIGQFSVLRLDLAGSDWIHARVFVRAAGKRDSRLTVVLKPKGAGRAQVPVRGVLLEGFQLHPWWLWIGARSGGASAHHDVDNVHAVASGCPPLDGRWDPAALPFPSPGERALPIHAALLPTGKVLFWDRHDKAPPGDHMPRLWDPATGALTAVADPGYDAFCAGHALRADGGLFVAGGHITDGDGLPFASTYHPQTGTWEPHPAMNAGRWYPTVTTLADGTLLTVAGSFVPHAGEVVENDLPEVFDPVAGTWRPLLTARRVQRLYPFMFLAPNGKVFEAGPEPDTRYLDTAGTGSWSALASSHYGLRDYGSAAMDRPGRVMILGGSPRDYSEPPTNSAEVIDLAQASPQWRTVPSMAFARRQHTATLLPDGTLLVLGGSGARGFNNALGAVRHAELWEPDSRTWRTLAPMAEPRLYHSVALLLPDGRVFVGGGGHPSDDDNGDSDHFEAELYSPPYLFGAPRPRITSAPAEVAYGSTFAVESPEAGAITAVTLVRLGAVTHGFDQNQRFVQLGFVGGGGGTLKVQAPALATLAPPGHYMLFILRAGVPSVARIVRMTGSELGPERVPKVTVGGLRSGARPARRDPRALLDHGDRRLGVCPQHLIAACTKGSEARYLLRPAVLAQ